MLAELHNVPLPNKPDLGAQGLRVASPGKTPSRGSEEQDHGHAIHQG